MMNLKNYNVIRSVVYRFLFVVSLGLIIFFISYLYALIQLNNQTNIANVANNKAITITEKKLNVHHTKKVNNLVLVNLPKPPSKAEVLDKKLDVNKQNNPNLDNNVLKEESPKPFINLDAKTDINTNIASKSKPEVKLPVTPKLFKQNSVLLTNPQHKKQRTQQVYQQIIHHNDTAIELAWPNNVQQYQAVLRYFEQCLGMGFGVITQQKVKSELLVLSAVKNNHTVSPWLRSIAGQLTVTEKRLMLNYNNSIETNSIKNNAEKVRLFPAFFDQTLAGFISNELKNKKLMSFFAHFNVTTKAGKKTLILEKQQLNGKSLLSPWLLHQC